MSTKTALFKVLSMIGLRKPALEIYDKYLMHQLKQQAQKQNLVLSMNNGQFEIINQDKKIILSESQIRRYAQSVINDFDFHFNDVFPRDINGIKIVDHSKPNVHTLKHNMINFWFSSFAVDTPMEGYFNCRVPKPGDIVFDVGAYCGLSSYYLSKVVGKTGKVYVFEPDNLNYQMLLKNIDLHSLTNVIPIKKGLWSETKSLAFSNEGTPSSSLSDMPYVSTTDTIDVLSFEDACKTLNLDKVDFVKMDIEGAEVDVISGSADFIKSMDIDFAIASYHKCGNVQSFEILEILFDNIGYETRTVYPAHLTTCAKRKQ
ncbi:MAG: FkbM family methyltransferase [Pedobacter sp.]|uniref:FkbM family methyltransferase n=1 Tax=Pedobacter sp. TaxID=1411316 RepID=UPI0035617B3A